MMLKVAIAGRPNVGKSTLFNRLSGKRLALVDDRPGVTRDRREGEARLGDLRFTIIDTAGLDEAGDETLAGRMHRQSLAAIDEADVILFVIDARTGITPADRHFAGEIRKTSKPVILLANKAEGGAGAGGVYDAWSLGLGDPVAISAAHGEGLDGLYEALRDHHDSKAQSEGEPETDITGKADFDDEDDDPSRPLRLAVIGQPNAGKSTLVNALIGSERLLTGPEAGITR
ncbi:MAG TPA: GTP-binding protein, partial [Rhizobiales bacterium]|nr:GTP-binding protein [Hyphomicrobiales bacterium]